ncbi:MAG: siphovirus Gp157 family protein [Oscillospiraceae bacterium]
MASLYEMTRDFEGLFEQYEAISDMEFASDGNGGYVDDDGNPVDPAAAREEMVQAWFDTLDGMEQEIQNKAEAVAIYIKSITAEAEIIKAEESRLRSRRQSKEKAAERMKKYLMDCMTAAKLKKIDMPRAAISIRNNAEAVEITDEGGFIAWAQANDRDDLLKYSAPEIRKTFVKQDLKAEKDIPYAKLTRSQSVIIK